MNQIITPLYFLAIVAVVLMWSRGIWLLFKKEFVAFVIVGVPASLATFALVHFWTDVESLIPYGFDWPLTVLMVVAAGGAFIASCGIVVASRDGFRFSPRVGQLLIIGPALLWASFLSAIVYKVGPITFEFFGTQKMTNTSPQIAGLVFAVMFISEYVGNHRNVLAKFAEVVTFVGGKRTGQSLNEGINAIPGMAPLLFQVTFFALFRFSLFWGSTRAFILAPVAFSGMFVARTMDHKFVVFEASGLAKIVDPTKYDDLIDDLAEDPRKSLKEVIVQTFNESSNRLISRLAWWQVEGDDHLGAKILRSTNLDLFGVKFTKVGFVWMGFKDDSMQRLFQEWAGRDLRGMSQSMKEDEVRQLLLILRQFEPGTTKGDAERIWESFHNGGRGSFKFDF